jgi:hypothetical protein
MPSIKRKRKLSDANINSLRLYPNSNIEFIRGQANAIAHSLAKMAIYLVSFQTLVNISHCIKYLLINEML